MSDGGKYKYAAGAGFPHERAAQGQEGHRVGRAHYLDHPPRRAGHHHRVHHPLGRQDGRHRREDRRHLQVRLMRHTKAQEMPYAAIIKALIVLAAGLAIFLGVSAGFLQKAMKEWLGQTDVILGDEQSGDYILRAGLEELRESEVTLHITPNPLRCAEIDDSNSFVIYQASSASPDIPDEAFKDNEVERISRHENCDSDQTVNFTLIEVDKPLNTHIVRLEVWGENPREVLETIDLEVNMWSVFLGGLMGVSVARLESSG